MLWRGTLDEPGTVSFTSATVNGQPARMLPGNVFEAMLHMTPGSNTVTLEARDTTGNTATKSYSVDVTGDGASYSYDPNGNLAQKVEGADIWTYEWNAENQLKRVLKNAVEVASFQYDPLGRRVEKVAGAVTTSFTYDGQAILRQVAGATTTRFAQGPGIDEPLAKEDAGSGALTYYHADGLGSIARVTDAVGGIVHSYQYDAWGNIELGADQPGYAFTGREWDPEIGLYYYRERYYDTQSGRFIGEDPIGLFGGANFYLYVLGNPVNLVDPFGLQAAAVLCCDGNGGFTYCLKQRDLPKPFRSCVIEHEMDHVEWAKENIPNQCKTPEGKCRPAGDSRFQMTKEQYCEMECRGHRAEYNCLKPKAAGAPAPAAVVRRMQDLKDMKPIERVTGQPCQCEFDRRRR
jgi:RHS repeat-associated protein